MLASSLLERLGVVGLSMAAPLFAVGSQRCRGSTFGSVLGLLGVVVALGVATTLIEAVPVGESTHQVLRLVFVGLAAVLSLVSAVRLRRMTDRRWYA